MSDRIVEQFERIASFLQPMIEWPQLAWTLLAVLALVILLFAIQRFSKARRPIVPFRAEGGDVEIAPQTIRGLINGTVKSVPGVKLAASRYDQRGHQLRLRVSIHLQASAKLIEVQHEIKRRIRLTLHSHIGMDPKDVDPIRIKVTKIIGEPDARNTATLALPARSGRPHPNPQIDAPEIDAPESSLEQPDSGTETASPSKHARPHD